VQKLTAKDAHTYCIKAEDVLRALAKGDQRMTYKEFGRAIGLVDEIWQPWHRQQVTFILNTTIDVNDLCNGELLQYHRVYNQATDQPGMGIARRSA